MTTNRTGNNTYAVQTYGFGLEAAGNTASMVVHSLPTSSDMSPQVQLMRTSPLLGFEEAWWDLIQARFPQDIAPATVDCDIIIETELLFDVAKVLYLDEITETELLFALTMGLGVAQIIETELLFVAGVGVTVGQIIETEVMFAVRATPDQVVLTQVVETESLFTVGIGIDVGAVIETEAPLPLGIGVSLGQVIEQELTFTATPTEHIDSLLSDEVTTRFRGGHKFMDKTRQ